MKLVFVVQCDGSSEWQCVRNAFVLAPMVIVAFVGASRVAWVAVARRVQLHGDGDRGGVRRL